MQPPMYDPNAGYDPSPGGYDPTGMSSPAQPMYTPQGSPQADWSSGGSGGKSGSPMLTISIIVLLVLGAAGAALYATDNLEVLPFIDIPNPNFNEKVKFGLSTIKYRRITGRLPKGYTKYMKMTNLPFHIIMEKWMKFYKLLLEETEKKKMFLKYINTENIIILDDTEELSFIDISSVYNMEYFDKISWNNGLYKLTIKQIWEKLK